MATTRSSPAIELDGLSPEDAFRVLGNETRLEILRVLWNAGAHHEYADVDDTTTTISFSVLRRAVDIRDNGKFNYHLGKLVPHFVRQSDDGYRLSGSGKTVMRAVVAISGERSDDVVDDLETACPLCGGQLSVTYEDQWLRFECTECRGDFGDTAPDGTVFHTEFPAAGLIDRSPDEALSTGIYRCMLDLTYLMQGICRDCASPVTASVSVCTEHDAERGRFCDSCGTLDATWADLRCETCRFAKRLPVEICIMGLTPVIAFLYERGIDVLAPSIHDLTDVVESAFRTDVTDDPLRVTITIEDRSDALTVTVDDELRVVDCSA